MTNDETIEAAAEAAHEVNRAFARALEDASHLPWAEAPEWQRDSSRMGVRLILQMPTVGPEGQHQKWLEHKQAEGWSWGPNKDPEAKTHPCMLPWSQLPQWERAKDILFQATVRAVLEYYESTEPGGRARAMDDRMADHRLTNRETPTVE